MTRLLAVDEENTVLLDQLLLEENERSTGELVTLIRLMGKTGVCSGLLDETVLCKVLDCSIKILMHREFIDVLLPWVSRIVHDAASKLVPTPKSGVKQNARNVGVKESKLLSLD